MIQPTGVELVVDWAVIVVDLWVLTVVGVTVVGETSVVGAASVVVVGGSVDDVVVGAPVVEGTVVLGVSVVSVLLVGDVVVDGRAAPVAGVDPLDSVVGVDADGEVAVGLVALPPPLLPQAEKSAASATSATPIPTRTRRPATACPRLSVRVVTSLSCLCVGSSQDGGKTVDQSVAMSTTVH